MAAPILSGKDLLGVIMALNKVGATEFSKEDELVSGNSSNGQISTILFHVCSFGVYCYLKY